MDDRNWDLGAAPSAKNDISLDDIMNEFKFDVPPLPKQDAPVKADSDAFSFEAKHVTTGREEPSALSARHEQAQAPAPVKPVPESAFTGEAAEDEVESYLHPAIDLDDYLSQADYEKQEQEAEIPEPIRRRESHAAARKSEGGLLGFFKNRGGRAERRSSRFTEEDDALDELSDSEVFSAPQSLADDGFDGDPTALEEDDPGVESFFPEENADPFPVHSGTIGRTEQEAREYIASLQAESGIPGRRERRSADYKVDLDDLLGIEAEPAAAPAASVKPAAKPDYPEERYDYASLYAEPADDAPVYSAEPEIDERFHLGGRNPRQAIAYGEKEIDLSADEDYVPVQQNEYNPSQWTPDYDDPLAERNDSDEPPRKKHKFLFGRGRKAAEAEPAAAEAPAEEDEITDVKARPAIYAVSADYMDSAEELEAPASIDNADYDDDDFDEYDSLGDGKKYTESEMYVPPTFREYVLSILASVWLKLRGTVRGRTAETMTDTEEDLGPEVTPTEASRYYGSFLRSMKYRVRISGVVLAILVYISLEMPVPGMLKTLPVDAALCFGLQAAILLLALDVVTNGVTNAFRLRFGADSLAVVSCLFTGIDALIVALSDTAAPHMPLCAISSASVVGLLLASYLSARGLRKATRVPAIGKHFYAVTGEAKLEPGEITLLKSLRSVKGFVRRAEEAGPDETLYTKISPLLFVLALLLSVIVMIAKKSYPEFIYIFSAMLVLTVPFGAMLSFSLPFFLGSTRIFKFGAAVAGWSGLCDIGASKNLIVTDRDLFPPEAVTIESVRIFADEDAQKVISYAGSMMSASGCCSAGCFEELMRETDSLMCVIDGFEILPGGGMKGIIDGHVVLCGSTDLMRLMNVRIPFRLTDKTTVLLAIDGILYGIFSLKYEGLPQVRKALVDLVRTARPPVFAVRDFNVNPEMLHNTFDLATDGYDFPPYVERFRLSEPAEEENVERIAAILCNEGLAPLTSVADLGRSMYMSTKINVVLNLIASVFGVLLVFVRFLASGTNTLASLFLFMVFCTLPVLLVSFFVNVRR